MFFLFKAVPVPGDKISLPYMNQQKVVNHCYRLNGNLIFPHNKIFSALIMVCKLTSCDVESQIGMVSSCVLAELYCVMPW